MKPQPDSFIGENFKLNPGADKMSCPRPYQFPLLFILGEFKNFLHEIPRSVKSLPNKLRIHECFSF